MTETSYGGGPNTDRASAAAASGLGDVKKQASELADKTTSKIDSARQPIADKLHGAAGAIRDQAQALAAGEGLVGVAKSAADKLESSATYLESHDTQQMIQDLVSIVKKHPTQSLLLAGAVGFLVARAFRSD
jgi:hypothetical protein